MEGITHKTGSKNVVCNVWTDAAREASAEAREAKAEHKDEQTPTGPENGSRLHGMIEQAVKSKEPRHIIKLTPPSRPWEDEAYTAQLPDGSNVRVLFKSGTSYSKAGRLRVPSKTRSVLGMTVSARPANYDFSTGGAEIKDYFSKTMVGESRENEDKRRAHEQKISEFAKKAFGLENGVQHWSR